MGSDDNQVCLLYRQWRAADNLVVKVAGARYGDPAIEEILEF